MNSIHLYRYLTRQKRQLLEQDVDVSRKLKQVHVSSKKYRRHHDAYDRLCSLDLPDYIRGGYNTKKRAYAASGTSVLKKRYLWLNLA